MDDYLARQAEKPKNVNPVITSAEMTRRRDDVVYTSAAIMNRPKPKPKVESTPGSGTQTPKDEPKNDKQQNGDATMEVEEDGGPSIEEMDVD